MEGEMARPGAGTRRRVAGGRELAGGTVQSVDLDPVDAAVGCDEETTAGIERNVVRVRAGPDLIAVRADLARRRNHVGERRERSIGIDREHRDAWAIADDDVAVARVRRQVRRISAGGRLLVQEPDPAARLFDCISADLGTIAVDRIEESLLAIEGDELRIGHRLERLQQRPGTVRIDPVKTDAFPLRVASFGGETSDIGEQRRAGRRGDLGRSRLHRQDRAADRERGHPTRRAEKKRPAGGRFRRKAGGGPLSGSERRRVSLLLHGIILPWGARLTGRLHSRQ